MIVKDIIFNIRHNLRVSRREFAIKFGFNDRAVISRVEKGEQDLKIEQMMYICKQLGITPNQFFTYSSMQGTVGI